MELLSTSAVQCGKCEFHPPTNLDDAVSELARVLTAPGTTAVTTGSAVNPAASITAPTTTTVAANVVSAVTAIRDGDTIAESGTICQQQQNAQRFQLIQLDPTAEAHAMMTNADAGSGAASASAAVWTQLRKQKNGRSRHRRAKEAPVE
jgi:hypothetical protein